MIKNLKWKFILINMSLVSLVLVIVFTAIVFFSFQRMQEDSYRGMVRFADAGGSFAPPRMISSQPPKRPTPLMPMFYVELDAAGRQHTVIRENVEVGEALIDEVVLRALAKDEERGILHDVRLFFLKQETPAGVRIVFADMSRELQSLVSLVRNLLAVGVGGLIAFLAISVFLADWALRPTQKAWEQQQRFVADASHELKTPLTVILANLGILLHHQDDTIQGQLKWVENTQAEAERMKNLIEQLLFLAKTDAAKAATTHQALDLSGMLWSALLPFESVAFERGLSIETDIEPEMVIRGDEGQLRQLAAILLDNAFKYTEAGGRVTVKAAIKAEMACLRVANTGQPIPATDLPHIFKRFYRVDDARDRGSGGYGLGLAIAKALADAHQGTIEAKNSDVEGTVFTVCLPRK
jgi:signal transduction histidine kinase